MVIIGRVLSECLSPREPCWALRHGRTGRVEAAERQNINFAQQVSGRPRRKLSLQLVIRLLCYIARLPFKAVWPMIIRRAIASVAKRLERPISRRARRIQIGVA